MNNSLRSILSATTWLLVAAGASAQQSRDSVAVHRLDALVVTAERTATPLGVATGAVSLLTAGDLRRSPVRTLAEAVQRAPGVTFVDFDGLGMDPQIMMRGFYGGGEAEYVLLLLDGRPLNSLETGRINWDLIPMPSVESIEVLRGGASAAWGDAAMGGVISVTTRNTGAPLTRASIVGGQYGVVRASGMHRDTWSGHPVSLFANVNRTDGYRGHAERSTGSAHASLGLMERADGMLTLSATSDWRSVEEPGPLNATDLSQSRTQTAPFYRFDEIEEQVHRIGLDGRTVTGFGGSLTGLLAGEYRDSDRVRTLPLAPFFADTKNRLLSTWRLLGSSQLELDALPLPGEDELLMGIDASFGRSSSEYYDFLQGSSETYADTTATRGALSESGSGSRLALAAFMSYGVEVTPALRLSLGGRVDWLRDAFDAREPDPSAEEATTHFAFSPKAGLNLRILDTDRQRGHVYANFTRSFKAPTPDQLFDQRMVPVEFPPYEISFANIELKPQYGTSVELGTQHQLTLIPNDLDVGLDLAIYHMDLRDELDFSVETFRYENIGKSRHRGVEVGVRLSGPAAIDAFANYTLQDATSRSGEDEGRRLKAIPRHSLVAGVSAGESTGLEASLTMTRADGMYLDDANTRELPGWTRWDARLAYPLGRAQLFGQVFNLFDAEYSTTGFPDPAGTGVVYFHPAAGRTVEAGITLTW